MRILKKSALVSKLKVMICRLRLILLLLMEKGLRVQTSALASMYKRHLRLTRLRISSEDENDLYKGTLGVGSKGPDKVASNDKPDVDNPHNATTSSGR